MMELRQLGRYLAVLYTGIIIDTRGLVFICCFLFTEDEAVVEEEIKNHNNNGVEDEGAGGENEFISKRQMNGASDIEGEFI